MKRKTEGEIPQSRPGILRRQKATGRHEQRSAPREGFGEADERLRLVDNSDKRFTAANGNLSPGARGPVAGPERFWIRPWAVPYVALAVLHKLLAFALPRQVQALKTPLYVTVNPDMLCSGVVFILESNSSSF